VIDRVAPTHDFDFGSRASRWDASM